MTATPYKSSRRYVRDAYALDPDTLRGELERVRYLLRCGIIAASWQRSALRAIEADIVAAIRGVAR